MKNTNMNGQNIRKTALAAIAALTMVFATSCGSVSDFAPTPAAAPEVTAAQTEVQPAETEAPAETEETESEAAEENTAESKEESKADTTSSEAKKPAQTTASKPKPASGNTSGGSSNKAPAQTTTAAPAPAPQAEQRVAQPIDMTVDRLLSSSVRELCDLSANDFEITDTVYDTQALYFGIKCASFPNYIFYPNFRVEDGEPEGPFELSAESYYGEPGKKVVLNDEIYLINLMRGASINNNVTVGMTYNEIKAVVGDDMGIQTINTSLGLCVQVEIDGKLWDIGFDLTDEQREEISRRIQARAEELGYDEITLDLMHDCRVDISDMNPTSFVAVHYTSRNR